MDIKRQFKNLKSGAKKVCVGMLILSLLCTATGIGSVFVYADEEEQILQGPFTDLAEEEGQEIPEDEEPGEDDPGDDGSGETPEHVHSYGDWLYDGDGTHYKECSECKDRVTENCSYDSYITNYNGTHLKRCSTCGNSEDEDCTFGDPVVSDDGTEVTVTCIYCGYSETMSNEDYVPEEDEPEDVKEDDRKSSSSKEETGDGPLSYSQFFSTPPTPAENLVFTGARQQLFADKGVKLTAEEQEALGITALSYTELDVTEGIKADTYVSTGKVEYTSIGADGEEGEYTATAVYTIEIKKASFKDDVVFSPATDSISFIEATEDEPFYTLTFHEGTITPGKDFTFVSSGDDLTTVPEVGMSATYDFSTMLPDLFYDEIVTKSITVEDVALTYNGDSVMDYKYHDKLTIGVPEGYGISKSSSGTFSKTIEYTHTQDSQFYVYIQYNSTNKIIKKQVEPFEITEDDLPEDFIDSYPEFYDEVELTGSDIDLMSKAPVLDYTVFNEKGYVKLSYGFRNTETGDVVYDKSPAAKDKGRYTYDFIIVVQKEAGKSPEVLDSGRDYSTTVVKNIGHSDIVYTPTADDYQSLDPSTDIVDFYTVKDNGSPLQKETHYSVSLDQEASYYETGKEITLTYTGIKEASGTHGAYYTGTTTKTIKVSPVTVLINGEAQKDKYDDAVKITAEGYTISDTPDGTFNTEFEYSTPCSDLDLTLYFKKDGTSRVVSQVIEDLNIGGAADVIVLYDGDEDLKPYYYDSVRISAKGYTVSKTKDGSYAGAYAVDYDASKNMQPVDDFVLFFKDTATGIIYQKTISGINLYETPEIEILYNGDELKDWYSDDVKITAKGYTISDEETTGFKTSYTMSGSGTVSKKLYFKNDAGTTDYMVVVCIDRTAPEGSIKVGSKSSNKFKKNDEELDYVNTQKNGTVTSSDDLSGVDYVHYYVCDTFYATEEDLLSEVSETSGKWRAFSAKSKPTTVKNKDNYMYVLIADKAGNKTIISIGNIIYDTVIPKVTTAKIVAAEQGTDVGVAGKDTLSGVDRFKVLIVEKDKEGKNPTPNKQKVFDDGEKISVESRSEGTAVGSWNTTGLDPEKTYLFYFVAVDKAGNISEVYTEEVEGEDVTPQSEEEGKESGSGGSGGLAPAPNGIAGSGTSDGGGAGGSGGAGGAGGSGGSGGAGGSGGSGTGGSGGSGTGGSDSPLGDNDRDITRDPYIAEATGQTKIGELETSGWNRISNEVNTADQGALIEVEMSGLSFVSGQLFDSMKEKDVQVNLRMANDVEWQIKGGNVASTVGDRDMGIKLGTRNIPNQVLNNVTGSYPHVEFSGTNPGDLGFEATIAVPVGDTNSGMVATLYSYDPDTKEMVITGTATVDDKGYAKFPMTSTGDCTVVITPEGVLSPGDPALYESGILTNEESETNQLNDSSRLRLTDIFSFRGNNGAWLFVLAFLSAAICLVILFLPAMQVQDRDDRGDYL